MSSLIARILLAIFMIPLASLVYLVTFFQSERWLDHWVAYQNYDNYRQRAQLHFALTGLTAWAFVGVWWFLLWRKSVRWTGPRIALTAVCATIAAGLGAVIAAVLNISERGFGDFVGSAAAPMLWLVGTIFVWRETAEERAARVHSSGRDSVVCPTCGYNLTGLKEPRCPECGTQFTLDQLLAAQPNRVNAEIEG